jgi:NAD(P)-dependent dehydrogenase (short-subunit alcohol dehydrogenase family)
MTLDGRTRLDGRTALVTGAGRGVGAAIARRLAAEGASLHLLDRDAQSVETLAKELQAYGVSAVSVVADLRDHGEVIRAIEQTRAESGPCQIVVNNAGRWTAGAFVDTTPELWHDEVAINFYGVLHVLHVTVPDMVAAGYGRIVNVISDSARVGEPNFSVYAAAKAAVAGFSRSLAKEIGPSGVSVNCVSLSTTKTPGAFETFDEGQIGRMTRFYPLRRLGEPEDAAAAVAYLASDDASWVTGQVLSVNGGYAMV